MFHVEHSEEEVHICEKDLQIVIEMRAGLGYNIRVADIIFDFKPSRSRPAGGTAGHGDYTTKSLILWYNIRTCGPTFDPASA